MKRVLALLLVSLTASLAQAQTVQYVADELSITVRSGKGNNFQILRTISTGTPVEALQTTEDGYTQIKLKDGVKGWVLSRFLLKIPIARDRLAKLEKEFELLKTANERLTSENATLTRDSSQTTQGLTEANAERERLRKETAELRELAKRPLELKAANTALRENIASLENEVVLLRDETSGLRESSNRMWFLTGAGILLGGIILGLLLPRISWRRKSSWDTF